MFLISKNKKGFASFVEVVVTAIIFMLAAVGILTSVSMLRPQGTQSSEKLEAAYIAKGVLEELRTAVDAVTWDDVTSDLSISGSPHTRAGTLSNGKAYTITYSVSAITTNPDTGTAYPVDIQPRRIDMTISY